jgi:hypothetical protein
MLPSNTAWIIVSLALLGGSKTHGSDSVMLYSAINRLTLAYAIFLLPPV